MFQVTIERGKCEIIHIQESIPQWEQELAERTAKLAEMEKEMK